MTSDFLIKIIEYAGVSAAISGLLLWLTKSWISERLHQAIKNEYDQKLETHKAQLKAQSDIELEKLRSELKIATMEHEVRFSKLHQMRAEIIAETYALLSELYSCMNNYVKVFEPAGDKPKEVRRQEAAAAHEKFRSCYAKKAIFLPKNTTKKLEDIDLGIVKLFNSFFIGVEMKIGGGGDGYKDWNNIFETLNGEMKVALDELADEMRLLIGDENRLASSSFIKSEIKERHG